MSRAQDTQTLPSPSTSVSSAIQAFARKKLSPTDMIYLLGNTQVLCMISPMLIQKEENKSKHYISSHL